MFKKILFGLAIAASFTACDDDYTDWADPMANGPEEPKAVAMTVNPVNPIDFATLSEGQTHVCLFDAVPQVEEGAEATYKVILSAEGVAEPIELTANDTCGVSVEELRAAVETLYGKRPTERTLSAHVYGYYNVKGQSIVKEGTTTIKVTLTAPVIETAYYLIGTQNGWSTSTVTDWKFSHSGKDVYEDPVFTITVPAPVDETGARVDFWFNIVPESQVAPLQGGDWSQLIGSDIGNGDDRTEAGISVKKNGADNAFVQYGADEAKFYTITLNMLDGKMTVTAVSYEEWIYVPGDHQGWNPKAAPALRSPESDGRYEGFTQLNGEFKFTKHRNWDDGEYNFNDFSSMDGIFSLGGGSNINCATTGFYKVVANVATGSLTATPITTIGLIGTATVNGWDGDTPMTYNATEGCWEVTTHLTASEFKFRANSDWGINFGGSFDDLSQDGANLLAPAEGDYTVRLYLQRTTSDKFYCTLNPATTHKKARRK